jgi:hypothetical protein
VKAIKKALEITAIVAAVFILISTAAALTFVNLKVIFAVDVMANEYRQRIEVFEIERQRHNHVVDRVERMLIQLENKYGRHIGPIAPKK